MSRIRILPDQVVNKIAAGEVIERPASVAKELIENALDAGARSIAIDVEAGGRRRIRVADDGEGLDRDDAVLAFERHATSKLASDPDLTRITTLGFRGEALAAIASVSRLTLETSRDGRSGTRVEVEGGRVRRVTETGHPRGATLDVRDLFFNTPARSKFLRSGATELGHISELVAAVAVAAYGIGIRLTHEDRRLLDAPPAGDSAGRIRQVHGARWADAIPFERQRSEVRARGLILPPSASSGSRRLQQLYVNGRLVRDRSVAHAIASATEGFIPKGRHAALFLFVTCPPEIVDVNVHPTKAEVRFREAGLVHDLVQEAIAEALGEARPVTGLRIAGTSAPERIAHPAPEAGLAEDAVAAAPAAHRAVVSFMDRRSSRMTREPRPAAAWNDDPVALAHYRLSYIVAADPEGILLVDQHAAHERILFERLRSEDGREDTRQNLLFPATVPLPRRLATRSGDVSADLEHLGFTVEPFGEGMLLVRATPAILGTADAESLVADLLEQLAAEEDSGGETRIRKRDRLIATIACHAAVKVRMSLTSEKMNYLIKELFRTSAPLTCPHGRPAVLRFTHAEIERGFDR